MSERKKYVNYDYHFYHELTYRDEKPEYNDCLLCDQIYSLFVNLKGNRDSILYQGHHYLVPADIKDILEYTELILAHSKVKKVCILYLDSLKEFKRDVINNLNYNDLRELINDEKYTLDKFENVLQNEDFKKEPYLKYWVKIITKEGKSN